MLDRNLRRAAALALALGCLTGTARANDLFNEPARSLASLLLNRLGCASPRAYLGGTIFGCDWEPTLQVRIHAAIKESGISEFVYFEWIDDPDNFPNGRAKAEDLLRKLLRVFHLSQEREIVAAFFSEPMATFRQGKLAVFTGAISRDNWIGHRMIIGEGSDLSPDDL